MASYLPIPQTEEPTVELQQHQGNHHRMQRRGGFCFRLTRVGSRIAVTLAFISLFSLAYFHLRSPHEISLSAFQVVPIRACKSWFEGADVSVASSSSNFVSVHRIDLNQFQVKTRDYSLGYNVTLYSDDYSPRSHIREFHFDAIAPFSVSFESTSPVLFFVKTEYHRHRDHRHKSHSDKHHDRKHPRSETTSSVQPEEFEASFKHGPSGNFSHVPHLEAALTGVRQVKPTLGKYTFVISLPKNTVDSQIDIKVKFDAKIATLSFDDCPYASSLREGRSHVRFNKHESKTIKHVIAASPHTAAGTVAFVKLIPRTHKFVLVSASLLAVAIFLRLINKFLRCKAKRACQRANGERRPCFFSRIFKRQPVQQAQPAFVHVVVPSPSAPVYTPQL